MENQIFQDLKGLHLSGMAECWQNLQETRKHQEIVLQDGLVMLIQAEQDQRAANKTARLIKNARFRYDASIEQVLFDPAKGRDQGRIMQLASCEYIRQGGAFSSPVPPESVKVICQQPLAIKPASPATGSVTST